MQHTENIIMNNTFPGFAHPATSLSAYIFSIDTFVISLKTGEVLHHVPEDPQAFEQWLIHHRIRDVKQELPKHITDALFRK